MTHTILPDYIKDMIDLQLSLYISEDCYANGQIIHIKDMYDCPNNTVPPELYHMNLAIQYILNMPLQINGKHIKNIFSDTNVMAIEIHHDINYPTLVISEHASYFANCGKTWYRNQTWKIIVYYDALEPFIKGG